MTEQETTRRWAVTYRRGRLVEVWAVIRDVPRETTRAQLQAALESWSRWPAWQRRIGAVGSIAIVPEHRWSRSTRDAMSEGQVTPFVSLAWDKLAPTARAITVRMDSTAWASWRAAAARDGLPLSEWARRALDAAAS